MNPQRQSGNEMIFAVSDDPNEKRKKPRQVPRKLMGTAAWKIHKMREVPDPNIEPVPVKITPVPVGPDERDEEIARLKAELASVMGQAKEAMGPSTTSATATQVEITPAKRGPGRPPKETPQA